VFSLWCACEDDGGVSRQGFWWLLVASAGKNHSDRSIGVDFVHRGGGGGLGISNIDLAI
jgi:hypothetical protein